MTVLRDTLVDNWQLVHLLLLFNLFFMVMFMFRQTLVEQLYYDKGL